MTSTVLFIHGSADGYGADRQLRVLAEGLDRTRFAPVVVLPEEGELAAPLREAGVPVHIEPLAVLRRDHLRGRGLVNAAVGYRRNMQVLGAIARVHRARIVHSNTSLVLCGQAVADRAGAAHVISVREIYEQTGGRAADVVWPVLRRSLLRADALACVSQACASQFGDSERAFVLHDAVPRDLELPAREAARDALGLDRDRFVAAVVGRISDWKGQEVFARALAEESLAEIGACGILAGEAAPGQRHFERRLESLRSELRLDGRLRPLGFRDDVETVLGAADVLVVPSTYQDPFPNVTLEAGATGLPVVGTTTGGQGEIIRDGTTGRLVPPRDHSALATVLRELADDPSHARRLGEAAATDIAQRFGREDMLERLQERYERLLRSPAPTNPRRGAPDDELEPERQPRTPKMISVVLPMRNEEAHVATQLSAMASQTYAGPWELVVVDNGSTDASVQVVEAWRERIPGLRIVDASEARGLNHARNRGADAARGDLLAFADADDEAVPGWLDSLAAAAATADLVGGPLDSDALNHGMVARSMPRGSERGGLPLAYGFLPFVPGGNCAVWASLARTLRWNEDYVFVVGGSDIEFSWRAHLAGARLGFAPGAVMRRRLPTTPRALGSKYFDYGRSGPLMYRQFRSMGMTRPPLGEAAREWAWLLRGVPRAALSPKFRARWLRVAGRRSGRVFGSLEQRVIYP